MRTPAHYAVFVADDVEQAWSGLTPYVVRNANSYASMAAAGGIEGPFTTEISQQDQASVRSRGGCTVLTQTQGVLHLELGAKARTMVQFVPLLSGIDPEFGWRSLELLASAALPQLDSLGIQWRDVHRTPDHASTP